MGFYLINSVSLYYFYKPEQPTEAIINFFYEITTFVNLDKLIGNLKKEDDLILKMSHIIQWLMWITD